MAATSAKDNAGKVKPIAADGAAAFLEKKQAMARGMCRDFIREEILETLSNCEVLIYGGSDCSMFTEI